jgi:hypothetical protein
MLLNKCGELRFRSPFFCKFVNVRFGSPHKRAFVLDHGIVGDDANGTILRWFLGCKDRPNRSSTQDRSTSPVLCTSATSA